MLSLIDVFLLDHSLYVELGLCACRGAISSQVGRQDNDIHDIFTAIHATLICFPTMLYVP